MKKTLVLAVFVWLAIGCVRDTGPAAAAASDLQAITLVANAAKAQHLYTVPQVLKVTVPNSSWQPVRNPYRHPNVVIAFAKRNQAAAISLRVMPAKQTPTRELAGLAKQFFQGSTVSWHWEFLGGGQQPARIRYVDSGSDATGQIDVRVLPGNPKRLLVTVGNWTKSNERFMFADFSTIVESVRAVR